MDNYVEIDNYEEDDSYIPTEETRGEETRGEEEKVSEEKSDRSRERDDKTNVGEKEERRGESRDSESRDERQRAESRDERRGESRDSESRDRDSDTTRRNKYAEPFVPSKYKNESLSSVFKRLSNFLHQYNYKIDSTYAKDDITRFVKITSKTRGYTYILVIPHKYTIDRLSDAIKLYNIDKTSSDKPEEVYDKITETSLLDDSKYLSSSAVDELTRYESIDIDHDSNLSLYEESELIRDQLRRLRNCVEDLRYKVCIESNNCVCIINTDNKISCYSYKNTHSVNEKYRRMYITIDLDTFYNSIDSVIRDTEVLEKNLYKILNKTHDKQVSAIKGYLRQFSNIGDLLESKYRSGDRYVEKIKSVTVKISKIDKKEKEILEEIKGIKSLISETDIVKNRKLQADLLQTQTLKNEAIEVLDDLKSSYDNFILEFETILVDNIGLLNTVTNNFKRIGIMKTK